MSLCGSTTTGSQLVSVMAGNSLPTATSSLCSSVSAVMSVTDTLSCGETESVAEDGGEKILIADPVLKSVTTASFAST